MLRSHLPILVVPLLLMVGCGLQDGKPLPFIKPIYQAELLDRGRFGAEVRQMLIRRRYDDLEGLADSIARHDIRWPSGAPYTATFYFRGFGETDEPSKAESWVHHLGRLRGWVRHRPVSAVARLALANGLIGRGDAARGTNWAYKVSSDQWERLARDMWAATRVLDSLPESGRNTPEWFEATLVVLHNAGLDSAYRQLASEAIRRRPDWHRHYVNMANHLMPRWYGEEGEVALFADTSTRSLPDSIADEFYARMVQHQSFFAQNVFDENPGLSWERTRRGLEAWRQRYPASLQPRSALALVAHHAGDRRTARKAFASIRDTIELEVWRSPERYWKARRWAMEGGLRAAR